VNKSLITTSVLSAFQEPIWTKTMFADQYQINANDGIKRLVNAPAVI